MLTFHLLRPLPSQKDSLVHTDETDIHQRHYNILKTGNIIIHDSGGGQISQMIDLFPSSYDAGNYLSSCVQGKLRTEEYAPLFFKPCAKRTRTLRYLVGSTYRGAVGLPLSCIVYSGRPSILTGFHGEGVPQSAIVVLACIGGGGCDT